MSISKSCISILHYFNKNSENYDSLKTVFQPNFQSISQKFAENREIAKIHFSSVNSKISEILNSNICIYILPYLEKNPRTMTL